MKRKHWILLSTLFIAGLSAGVYTYNKPHQDMQHARADLKANASDLYAEFEENETEANTKYLDKVIQVEGMIRQIDKENGLLNITLESENELSGVVCQMDHLSDDYSADQFQVNEKITLKGICTGMLMDVVLVRCVPLSKH